MSLPKRTSQIKHKKNFKKKKAAKKTPKPILHKHSKQEQSQIKKIDNRIGNFFSKSSLDEIARKTGFLIRTSPITPFIFFYALSMGLLGVNLSLDLLAININAIFGTDLTGAAFSARMGEKKSLSFLKSCFKCFLSVQLESAFDNKFDTIFSMFKQVLLEDSTVVELNGKVGTKLKGSGGCASKSSLKLNWLFNICSYSAVSVDLYSGSTPDRKIAEKNIGHIKKGVLMIRDLGYFVINTLRMIEKKGAYYLSRIPKGSYLYLNEEDETPLDINEFFKKLTSRGKSAIIRIFIGKVERFSTTLILQKVPKWVLKQRIKQYKKKNSGKLPSDDFVIWARYSVYITNIPKELMTEDGEKREFRELIMEIYRVRWQIELLFKKFKSKIKLNLIKGKTKTHVLCAVYGKLISILLSLILLSYAASKRYKGREISLSKVTAWLISAGRLAKAVREGTFAMLFSDLCGEFKLLSKDLRKRQTALECIEESFQCKKMVA